LFGFQRPLARFGANLGIAVSPSDSAGARQRVQVPAGRWDRSSVAPEGQGTRERSIRAVLFWTGFLFRWAMEVVWIRAFAPVSEDQVYSFAWWWPPCSTFWRHADRRHLHRRVKVAPAILLANFFAQPRLLPVFWQRPSLYGPTGAPTHPRAGLSQLWPFCGILGYLTPRFGGCYAGGLPSRRWQGLRDQRFGCIWGLYLPRIFAPCVQRAIPLILLILPLLAWR